MYKNIIIVLFLVTVTISIINTAYAEYTEKVTQVTDKGTIKVFVGQSDKDKKSDTEKKNVKYSGKVLDVNSQPLAGVIVRIYEITVDIATREFEAELNSQTTTKDDGVFNFNVGKDFDVYGGQQWMIVAEKKGLSLGWDNLYPKRNSDIEIKLEKPATLAGIVVDESNNPVKDAEVRISMMEAGEGQKRYFTSIGKIDLLLVKTDEQGKFSFNNIPPDATAEFMVSKPGRATINTFDVDSFRGGKLQYSPGQKDIKFVQAVESIINGKVVEKQSGKPVPGVKIALSDITKKIYFGIDTVLTQSDGTFEFKGLAAGNYILKTISPKDEIANWVAEPLDINVEDGKTKSGIIVEVGKGGLLEISTTDSDNKPIETAMVTLQTTDNKEFLHAKTDKNGIASIRLVPGEYKINGIFKKDCSFERPEETFKIEDNKTIRLSFKAKTQPKVTGVVRDPDGKPVEGADVGIFPMGGPGNTKTDSEGKFELSSDFPRWGGPDEEFPRYLIVRDEKRNLAGSVELDENQNTVDIKLEPGITINGVVVGPDDKPISQARVSISIMITKNGRGWGSSINREGGIKTNTEGKFTVNAIPLGHKCYVDASADGYGRKNVNIHSDDAVNNQIDVGKLELNLANLSLSGIVVDINDKPIEGANINAYGDGQPHCNTKTDKEGKFKIDKVCPGKINISVYVQGKDNLHGYIQTEGGAEDVKIVASRQSSRVRYVPRQPPKLAGKKLPDLKDLNIELSQADTNDKKILVCFWDFNQRPSRHIMSELAKQAEQLKQKGITVVAIQTEKADKNTLDEWVKKLNIPFTIGMIQEDSEKTQFKWGVKSLPWFILTDNNQVISAEGFGLSQLDDKIK